MVLYYIPDRRHQTLTKVLRKHVKIGSAVITDGMTSYVRPKSDSSRLDQYGFNHFYFDLNQVSIHEKFSFVFINTIRANFNQVKKHISAHHRVYVPEEKID
jgi:hypothetical protein